MAIGIPYVASPVGINTEMTEEGINGFLAKDEEEWYEKITFLVNNPGKRKEIGEKARKIVEEKYSFSVATPKMLRFLDEIGAKP